MNHNEKIIHTGYECSPESRVRPRPTEEYGKSLQAPFEVFSLFCQIMTTSSCVCRYERVSIGDRIDRREESKTWAYLLAIERLPEAVRAQCVRLTSL